MTNFLFRLRRRLQETANRTVDEARRDSLAGAAAVLDRLIAGRGR